MLKAIVEADPTATMDEIRVELERRTGTRVHGQPIGRTLSAEGIERRTDIVGIQVETSQETDPRNG